MKRILFIMFAFLLVLAVALVPTVFPMKALAADGDALVARQGMNGFTDTISAFCAGGDTVWMLGETGVYAYDAVSGDIQAWPFAADWVARRAAWDDARQCAVYQNIAAWFCRGGEPCALVQARTDEGVVDVWLARVVVNGEARLEPMWSVDWRPLDVTGDIGILSCVVVGDTLCAIAGENGEDVAAELALIPLDGSPTLLTNVRGREVCAYEGGVAVLRDEWNNDETVILSYDLATGEANILYRQDIKLGIGGLIQEPGTRRLLARMDGYVTAIDPETGGTERVAPASLMTEQAGGMAAAVLESGLYVTGGSGGVMVRRVTDRGNRDVVLNVDELGWSPVLTEAALALEQANPDISVAFGCQEDVVRMLVTHSDEMDIIVGYSIYDGGMTALRDVLSRGYAAELDNAVLADYVGSMYPALSDLFTRDGKPVAVPLSADVEGLSVNLAALRELGFTTDDIPAAWPAFFDFIESAKGRGVPVLFGYGHGYGRQALLRRLFYDASLEIEAGRMERYDSPEMLAALEAFSRVDWTAIFDEADPLLGEKKALVNATDSVGVSAASFDGENARWPLRLSLVGDRPAVMPVNGMVAYVNPASRHIAEATALLEAAVAQMSHADRAALSPSFGQPEIDEAAYRRADEALARQIESLQARVNAGDEAARAELNACLGERETLEDRYRLISRDSLDWYRAHDDDVMFAMTGELDEIDFDGLMEHCLDQGSDVAQLAREVEKKASMRRLER